MSRRIFPSLGGFQRTHNEFFREFLVGTALFRSGLRPKSFPFYAHAPVVDGIPQYINSRFYVDAEGNLVATRATITGSIIAGAGSSVPGGFIVANTIAGDRLLVDTITSRELIKTAALITHSAQIGSLVVHNAHINDLNAVKINAGFLAVDRLDVGVAYIRDTRMLGSLVVHDAHIANIHGGKIFADTITSRELIKTAALITHTAQVGTAVIHDAHIANLSAEKINAGTLTGRTIQTSFTGRRTRISSEPGLMDRISFLNDATEVGYLRLVLSGTDWELSLGGPDGDIFNVATATGVAPIMRVSMPFFRGSGRAATGGVEMWGGGAGNMRSIGLEWSGGGFPIFRLGLHGLTHIGDSLVPSFHNHFDLGTPTLRWRDLFIGRDVHISRDLIVAGWVNSNLVPLTNNHWWLGTATLKWAWVHYVNRGFCDLPTSQNAIEIIKKVKPCKKKSGLYGNRDYFIDDEQFPDEMRCLNEKEGKKEMELTRVTGVMFQAIRELIEKVDILEKSIIIK